MADLDTLAKKVSENAHCVYSKFPVGAALVTKAGLTHVGCNVENISFGLTVCAERNAIGAMIAAGDKEPQEIVVYTPTNEPTLPCGACRQVLAEFNPNIKVRSICKTDAKFEDHLGNLLPHAFADLDH